MPPPRWNHAPHTPSTTTSPLSSGDAAILSSAEAASRVAILIVTHNSAEHLPALLASLEKLAYPHVFICDAASTDETVAMLRASPFATRVLRKARVESFAKNHNDLLRHFRIAQPFFLTLNPDTFFDMDLVQALVATALEDPRRAIVCPKFFYPDGRPQQAWRRFPSVRVAALRRLRLLPESATAVDAPGDIDWCRGACLLVRRDRLDNPWTLFDERYRLYCEDVDLCFTMRHKGFTVRATDSARVFHHFAHAGYLRPLSRRGFWNLQSMAKFFLKWRRAYGRLQPA